MKKVLITGGNKGIGFEITKLFLKKGYFVIVIARDFSNFKIESNNLKTISFDLTNSKYLDKLCSKIGKIDILINNAGVLYGLEQSKYSNEQIDYIMQLNLLTPIKLIEFFLKTNNRLRVVNTSSLAGKIGDEDLYYGVTKAGIINMTKSFAIKKGKKGLIINSVCPGPVDNDMLKIIDEERKKSILEVSLSGKFNSSINVAKTVLWLATDSPNTINGCSIDINDGMYFN